MSKAAEVLRIVNPHYTVRVNESMLRIDLKGSLRNDIEEAFENTPVLAQTIGNILEMFIPLHVRLSDIYSVRMDKTGKVTVKLPLHRDVVLQLGPKDAKRLVDKLNQLMPIAKDKELKRLMREHKLQRIEKGEHELAREELSQSLGGAQFPVPEPRGMLEEEKKEAKEREN